MFLDLEYRVIPGEIIYLDKNSSILITFIGRSQMMGSSKSTVIISCINIHILFSIIIAWKFCIGTANCVHQHWEIDQNSRLKRMEILHHVTFLWDDPVPYT